MKQERNCKMFQRKDRKFLAAAAILIIYSLFFAIDAIAQDEKDQWQFAITPYLWLPSVNGTFKYDIPPGAGGSPEVEIDADDILERLDLALMISGEARKGRWAAFTDFIYIDFSNLNSNVKSIDVTGRLPVSSAIDAGTESSLKGAAWTLAGSYGVAQGDLGRFELLAGFRYFGLEVSTDWELSTTVTGPGGSQVFPRSGSVEKSEDLWDGIIGLRGRLNLGGSKFYIPYYIDVGTGSSKVTWQGMTGLAYGFKWIDILLAYRHLYYEMDDDELVQDLSLSGPEIGLTFRF
jgi:hypothetical protein